MEAATEEAGRLKIQRLRKKTSRHGAKVEKAAEAKSLVTTVPLATVASGGQEVAQGQNPDVNVNTVTLAQQRERAFAVIGPQQTVGVCGRVLPANVTSVNELDQQCRVSWGHHDEYYESISR